ncbi:MAG TPA: VOC family protein [Candidatus Binatus sp.]|jgi:glyoxylase I family protein|nr:VOC family protein [Candidatus Binatus sp.]
MAINARYVHTNLIAGDWKKLVRFYRDVFGCIPRGPERDLSGEWLDRVTSLSAARLGGVHLRLPGYGDTGPTLEIFSYEDTSDKQLPMPNEPGFAHIAFAVDDVEQALETVISAGGGSVGEIATTEVDGVGSLQVVYARDPEGNIVELQKWS